MRARRAGFQRYRPLSGRAERGLKHRSARVHYCISATARR